MLEWKIGSSNGDIIITFGVETFGSIESDSRITSIPEAFYETLDLKPTFYCLNEFICQLRVLMAQNFPIKGI